MDKLLAKYFQVFLYIGLVTGHWSNPGFEARMLEGRWECRGVEFCRFYVFTQEMSLECYKWLVKREPVGDTVFSTFAKYAPASSQIYSQFIYPSFWGSQYFSEHPINKVAALLDYVPEA